MWTRTIVKPDNTNKPQSSDNVWRNDSKEQEAYTPAPAPVAESTAYATARVQQMTRNVLNSDVEVVGSLRFSDDLLIDGNVEGDISSEGVLSVGENAVIRAEIKTKSVIIHGKVFGNITVTDRVELKSTAELVGDIQATSLAIEAGAIFIGHSTVGTPTIVSAAPVVNAVPAAPVEPAVVSQSELDIDAE